MVHSAMAASIPRKTKNGRDCQARRQRSAVIASGAKRSRGTSGASHVLLDRHAASRLAMTERPSSSEASDRALLGSCKWPGGPAQPFEKARCAEGQSLDFPSPG